MYRLYEHGAELISLLVATGYTRSEGPGTFADVQYDRDAEDQRLQQQMGGIRFVLWEVNEQHIKFRPRFLNSILLSVCRQSTISRITFVKALIMCTNG